MAAAFAAVRARLEAAKLVLTQAPGDEACVALSKIQLAALKDIVQGQSLDAGQCASLTELACGCGFHATLLSDVLALFLPSARKTLMRERREMQDYSSFSDFLTETDWQNLLDADAAEQIKLCTIIRRALSLGLRCPREPSMKLLAVL